MQMIERTSKNERGLLRQLADVSQTVVAQRMSTSETTISRMKDGEINKISRFTAALNMKIVPADWVCKCPEYIKSLETLAKIALDNQDATKLSWDN